MKERIRKINPIVKGKIIVGLAKILEKVKVITESDLEFWKITVSSLVEHEIRNLFEAKEK